MKRRKLGYSCAQHSTGVPAWLLGIMTLSGTLSMHMFLPALPMAGVDLHANPKSLQMTVTFYIWGLALGQLIHGPLADRYGRRPVLLAGIGVYAVSGFVAAFSPSVELLVVARLFQALGGCAGMVIARAIVRDTAVESDAQRRMALLNLMITAGPGIAPIVGAAMLHMSGWRSIFLLLGGIGLFSFLCTFFVLPETNSGRDGSHLGDLLGKYVRLIRNPVFLGYAVGGGCVTTAWYAFISAAPFIFHEEFGVSATETGIYLGIVVTGLWLGSLAATRFAVGRSTSQMLKIGHRISFVAACALLPLTLLRLTSPVAVTLLMFVFTLGVGLAGPAAVTQVTGVNTQVSGSASGLYGFTQMAVGAVASALASSGPNPAIASAVILVGAGLAAELMFKMARRHRISSG